MTRIYFAIGTVAMSVNFLGALCSYADIGGSEANPTGSNPHTWDGSTLANIVQNASDVPEQMEVSDAGKMFMVGYDFSGSSLDFSSPSNYFVNISGGEGGTAELYGVGAFDGNGQGFCQLSFEKPSLSDTNISLTDGTPLRLTIVDKDSVYALDEELKYIPHDPDFGTFFLYTGGEGEKIGTTVTTATETSSVTVTNDMTLTWNWETQYTLAASSPTGGSVTGSTNGWYASGSPISITANPDEHEVFESWSNAPAGSESNNPAVFNLDQPYTNIVANYIPEQHTLTVVSSHGTPNPGTVTRDYNSVSVQTIESLVPGAPGVRYRNVGSTVTND